MLLLKQPISWPQAWIGRDGSKVLVSEMENQHLINVLRMLRRNADKWRVRKLRHAWNSVLAKHCCENWQNCYGNSARQIISSLVNECIERGIAWESVAAHPHRPEGFDLPVDMARFRMID